MNTTLAAELAENRRWKPRLKGFNYRMFDELAENEFASDENQRLWLRKMLDLLLRFSESNVPFYRDQWKRLGITAGDIQGPDDLPRLPVLTRTDVVENAKTLQPKQLPKGAKRYGVMKSSGTTGTPVEIATTVFQNLLYSFLWQRQARWFRFDPTATLCDIRSSREIYRPNAAEPNPNGNIVRRPRWRYLGQFFQTGPEIGFNDTNNVEQQVEWIKETHPDYLMSDGGLLEEIALANGGRSPSANVKAILAVGTLVTDSLRKQLTRFYNVPIYQTYGLNEIGKAAFRCNAGRYHTNTENCYIEIVDEQGQPCEAGMSGRVVITALRNPAMPLIRYDTGDIAEVADGPCPCGRTLPSFGEVLGRFRRYAGLPPLTRERFTTLRVAVIDMPVKDLQFMRQLQVHLYRDNRYELRLRTEGPIPESFRQRIQTAWQEMDIEPRVPLDIVRVDAISRSPSGKLLDFTSDFHEDDVGRQ